MKRVQAACICQVLHFILKEDIDRHTAEQLVRQEVANYKEGLKRHHIRHKIVEETVQPDGSILLKIVKQYNASPVGNYLD